MALSRWPVCFHTTEGRAEKRLKRGVNVPAASCGEALAEPRTSQQPSVHIMRAAGLAWADRMTVAKTTAPKQLQHPPLLFVTVSFPSEELEEMKHRQDQVLNRGLALSSGNQQAHRGRTFLP